MVNIRAGFGVNIILIIITWCCTWSAAQTLKNTGFAGTRTKSSVPKMSDGEAKPQSAAMNTPSDDSTAAKTPAPTDPKVEAAMKTIKDLDLFSMVLSLLERVSRGEVLPKDVYNEASSSATVSHPSQTLTSGRSDSCANCARTRGRPGATGSGPRH